MSPDIKIIKLWYDKFKDTEYVAHLPRTVWKGGSSETVFRVKSQEIIAGW